MNMHLESELAQLPEPVPPATLAGSVMARVSRLAEERTPTAVAAPASAVVSRQVLGRRWHDLPAWLAVLAGLAIVSWAAGFVEAGSWLALMSPTIGWPHLVRVPPGDFAALGLALGMLIYLAGLFAPLRGRR